MDKTEIVDFEGQRYVDPHLSQDERLAFANQLREVMGAETDRIASQTKTLGTDVPSVQGGLSGANGYFAQRYQTTPVETQVRTLEAAARAKALNDLMSNYETQVKNRYNQAYRSAQRSASSSGGGVDESEDESALSFRINGTDDDKTTVSTTDWQNRVGALNSEPGGQLYFLSYQTPYKNPVKTYIKNLTSADDMSGVLGSLGSGYNGQQKTVNGVQYIYLDTGQLAPSWYRIGASGPTGGKK